MAKNTVKGLEDLIKRLEKAPKEAREEIDEVLKQAAQEIEDLAKQRAPFNLGALRGGIRAQEVGELTYRVVANADGRSKYAPYVEFGTGRRVDPTLTPEQAAMAEQFQGKTGESKEAAFDAIYKWASRKGIPEEQWYFIAINILRNGIHPQPFLWPAYEQVKPRVLGDIDDVLDRFEKI